MLIFEKTGKVLPEQDKTNIPLEFNVPSGIEKLVIDYEYAPKILNDEAKATDLLQKSIEKYLGNEYKAEPKDFMPVKNLITLSLDENGNYRGAAHRQADRQHHEISRNSASVGFEKGEIKSGKWTLVLNVHCCACEVGYNVKITGEEKV
ncbi:MAG: hypothetical protein K2I14_07420 [Eubacterium sp.]|nr:hypothetical protein [Eubacterium sp.]